MAPDEWWILSAGAAPHCPAGHFSRYSDGEKDAAVDDFANHHGGKTSADLPASSLLPVAIRGEGAGRRMRDSANVDKRLCAIA